MDNLFSNVSDKDHLAKLDSLKKNIDFAKRLMRDLSQVYDVVSRL